MTILKENLAARNQSDRSKAFIRLLRNNGLAGSMERVASASDDTAVDVTNRNWRRCSSEFSPPHDLITVLVMIGPITRGRPSCRDHFSQSFD
jgi:hypothetical protein